MVTLSSQMTRALLRRWRNETTFYCPQCEEVVLLRVGDIVIPHFAHKRDVSCSATFSEGESQVHLEGKRQLYFFFQKAIKNVELEPYVHMLSQRPDLLVMNHDQKYPIEFQCSVIPISHIESRTAGYKSIGMKPIWILQTPKKLQTLPQGVGIFQFSKFEAHFFTKQSPEGFVLLTYNPLTEKFHYFSSLLYVAGKRYIGLHRTLSISKQIFPFARPKIPIKKEVQRFVWLYLSIREKLIQSRIFANRRGINDRFLRGCYELRLLPIELPLWIGVPVPFMSSFREHPCEWQVSFLHFMKESRVRLEDLSASMIRKFVGQFDGQSSEQIKACIMYRDFLRSIGIELVDTAFKMDESQLHEQLVATLLAK